MGASGQGGKLFPTAHRGSGHRGPHTARCPARGAQGKTHRPAAHGGFDTGRGVHAGLQPIGSAPGPSSISWKGHDTRPGWEPRRQSVGRRWTERLPAAPGADASRCTGREFEPQPALERRGAVSAGGRGIFPDAGLPCENREHPADGGVRWSFEFASAHITPWKMDTYQLTQSVRVLSCPSSAAPTKTRNVLLTEWPGPPGAVPRPARPAGPHRGRLRTSVAREPRLESAGLGDAGAGGGRTRWPEGNGEDRSHTAHSLTQSM